MNRYHYLNELADIRDYLREVHPNGGIPQPICDLFNSLATKLSGTRYTDWCTPHVSWGQATTLAMAQCSESDCAIDAPHSHIPRKVREEQA